MSRLIIILSQTKYQVLISLIILLNFYVSILMSPDSYVYYIQNNNISFYLGIFGSILALSTSISYAYLVYFLSQTNNRKHDLFHKFKSKLFVFDSYLESLPKYNIVDSMFEFSWKMKQLKQSDFPFDEWKLEVENLMKVYDTSKTEEFEDPNMKNKVLGFLVYLEELLDEFNLMCIRQIIAGLFVNIVIKSFLLIASLIFIMLINYISKNELMLFILSGMPVFFGVMVCLIFLQIGRYIHKDSEEMLDFIEKKENI